MTSDRTFGIEDMEHPELCSFAAGTVAVYSARCPGKESPNEDAAALLPINGDTGILIVADGAGGMPNGHIASHLAIRSVTAAVRKAVQQDTPLRDGVLNGIESANRAVLDLGAGAATTLAVAKIWRGTIRSFHVGDSMILVTGQRGRIKLQTISHSPVGYAVESGILDEAEAVHHEERHFVSNVLGMNDMRIEMGGKIPLAARDTVVLATDGLFDNFYLDEIIERVRKGSLGELARELARVGRSRMQQKDSSLPRKPDDLTFIVYRRDPPRRRATPLEGRAR